jgi:hypothetical protein
LFTFEAGGAEQEECQAVKEQNEIQLRTKKGGHDFSHAINAAAYSSAAMEPSLSIVPMDR